MGLCWVGYAVGTTTVEGLRSFVAAGGVDLGSQIEVRERIARLDLDKSWEGINFVLGGQYFEPGPGAAGAIHAGEPFGSSSWSLVDPDRVREIAQGLDALTEDVVHTRYDELFEELGEGFLYPGVGAYDRDDGLWDDDVSSLIDFYRTAAGAGTFVVISLS